jgi:hypothetical protein
MFVEQITSLMPCVLTAKKFAEHTTTFIPIIIQLKDKRYAVAKEIKCLESGNQYQFEISKEQIVNPDNIFDKRCGRKKGGKNSHPLVFHIVKNINDSLPIEQLKEERIEKVKRFPEGWKI